MKPILLLSLAFIFSENAFAEDISKYIDTDFTKMPIDQRSENDCSRWNDGTEGRELCRIAEALEKIAEKETRSISKTVPVKTISTGIFSEESK